MSDHFQMETEAGRLRSEGKAEEAAKVLHQILEEDPKFVRAHLALAVTYHALEDYEKSIQHGEKACEIEPSDPFNFTALSVTYRRAFSGTNDPKYITMAEDAKARADAMAQ